MDTQFSESELMSFLEYLTDKNLLNPSTASAKKAAVVKVLSAIGNEEKQDLRTLDRDQVIQRFSNKYAKEFTPESLVTYKSRFNSVLSDFFNFKANPAGFKVGGSKKPTKESSLDGKVGTKKSNPKGNLPPPLSDALRPNSYVLQIPISDGSLLEIRNFPMDLKEEDANKIAAIIKAHVPTKVAKQTPT